MRTRQDFWMPEACGYKAFGEPSEWATVRPAGKHDAEVRRKTEAERRGRFSAPEPYAQLSAETGDRRTPRFRRPPLSTRHFFENESASRQTPYRVLIRRGRHADVDRRPRIKSATTTKFL
jgi:hypothetical protein